MDMLPTSLEPVDGSPTQQISLIGSGQTEKLKKEKEHYEIINKRLPTWRRRWKNSTDAGNICLKKLK